MKVDNIFTIIYNKTRKGQYMDDEKKEVETVEEKQETEPAESETVEAESTTEETKEAEPDYKSMYEKLMKEHEDLQAKYKERFSETADLSEQAQTGADLSEAIDEGNEETISSLFEESGRQSSKGLSGQVENIAHAAKGLADESFTTDESNEYKGTTSEQIGRWIADKTGLSKKSADTREAIKDYVTNPNEAFRKRSVFGQFEDLFENASDTLKSIGKGITTAERNRNF